MLQYDTRPFSALTFFPSRNSHNQQEPRWILDAGIESAMNQVPNNWIVKSIAILTRKDSHNNLKGSDWVLIMV